MTDKLRKKEKAKKEDIVCRLWQNEVGTHHSERRQQTMSEKIVQFNEEIIKGQIKELVRGSVEEALNDLHACSKKSEFY